MELDRDLPALVLRADPNPAHHGTLGAVRSLGRRGIAVHGALAVQAGARDAAATSRHLLAGHRLTGGPHDPDAFLAELDAAAAAIGRRALLLPMDDASAILVAEHAAGLADRFVLTPQDPNAPRRVADKARLTDECTALGLPVPATERATTVPEVDAALGRLGLPVIAKWARPWLLPYGVRGTTLVRTRGHAAALLASGDHGAGPLLLQTVVPAGGGDWFFEGYFGHDGDLLFGGTGRKHVAHPVDTGHAVAGEWLYNPDLEEVAIKIVQMLGCRGPVDLDFRFDPEAGEYRLLDFNPRLGAQFRLFTDGAGLDLAAVAHLEASGRDVPHAVPRYGRKLVVETQLLRSRKDLVRRARTVLRADELAWWDAADPGPLRAVAGLALSQMTGRRLR